MKKFLKGILIGFGVLLLIAILFIGSLYAYFTYRDHQPFGQLKTSFEPGRLGRNVVPFIGTGGYFWVCANNFPGASMPFGVVRLSPDTESSLFRKKAMNTSGYYYPDNQIIGFSHTRLSGTGATDGGHFRIIPATSDNGWKDYQEGRYSSFRHENERAFPGYYAVKLNQPDVLAEFTATMRTGIHRYTFSNEAEPHLLLDVCSVLGDKDIESGSVTIDPNKTEFSAEVKTFGTFASRYGGIKVYLFGRFDRSFSRSVILDGVSPVSDQRQGSGKSLGVDFKFDKTQKPIGLRIGISHVSIENARQDLETETGGLSFDALVEAGKSKWEEKFALIEPVFDNEKTKIIFYTALYRSFQMPTLFQDVNGDYLGFDKKVHKTEGFNYYTDLSLWDTFRTLHSLYILIAPKEQRDMLVSLVKMKEQGGYLPRWPSGNGYTGSMLGSPADMVISESYQKGIRNFDVKSAYEGMKFLALNPTPKGARFGGRRGIEAYNQYGYCPTDLMDQAVSRTLEYAWADHAIAILADSLGYKEDAKLFYEHAQYYKNVWNPVTMYFQSRDSKGVFSKAFEPLRLSYFDTDGKYTKDFVEGSALQWRFAVPYDPQGLITLFGGDEAFARELNDFFEKSDPTMSSWNPGCYYWHGNEPDIHSAYLFNEAHRPDLTQKWSGWILDNKYDVNAEGVDGNDDGATLSSWYLFASLGLYPIAGSDYYELGAPMFIKATIHLGDKILEVVTDNYSPKNRYVSKIWLNGKLLSSFRLNHQQIANGGILKFEMSYLPVRMNN
ncbi:MAG: GH92 family glycosyl hydrolase [Bacteroidia bacterium]|nr:GH92 family glycosyl hydrolase [Bacteroidia bacterium]